jgi:hypothetical protein
MRLALSELKIPLSGAAAALVSGLLLGGAMQPHLYEGDRPSGPQMFADWAGARSTGPFDSGTTFVNYPGKMPDYVRGTDWNRATAWPDERAPAAVSSEAAQDDETPPPSRAAFTRTAYEEPYAPPPGYPSLGGARPASDHGVDDDTVADAPAVPG